EHNHFVRVDKAVNWVIPRPRLARALKILFLAGGITALAGCGAIISSPPGPLDWQGPEFLEFYTVFLVICFAIAALLRWQLRLPSDPQPADKSDLDSFEVAYLNQGPVLAVNAAMASLID